MIFTRAAVLALAFILQAGPARGHVIIEGFPGWQGGLLHPLLVPAHALSLMGLALLAGQQHKSHRLALTLIFPASLLAAIVLITRAYAANNPDVLLLGCGAAAGLLVALGRALPIVTTGALIIAGAVALEFDSVPAVSSIQETLEALLATTLSASLALALVAWVTAEPRWQWQKIGTRIAGSWIAASAILVLTLRFAR